MNTTQFNMNKAPNAAGRWSYRKDDTQEWIEVLVEETLFSGRFCKQLKMGGNFQCGFSDWDGTFLKIYE